MKAEEARKLVSEALSGPIIQPMLEHIYKKIKAAANQGLGEVYYPLNDYGARIEPSQETAVYNRLRADGYKVTHHKSNDQRESSYYSIEW